MLYQYHFIGVAVLNDRIYVIGGYDESNQSNTFDLIDEIGYKW